MFGITTTGWRDFLEDSLGLSPEAALKFQAALTQTHAVRDRPNVESTKLSQICKLR